MYTYIIHTQVTLHYVSTWFMMVLKACSVLTTVMFRSWAWLGAAETWMHSDLPDTVSSSHLMLKSLIDFLMFLAMIVARGLLLPAVDNSLWKLRSSEFSSKDLHLLHVVRNGIHNMHAGPDKAWAYMTLYMTYCIAENFHKLRRLRATYESFRLGVPHPPTCTCMRLVRIPRKFLHEMLTSYRSVKVIRHYAVRVISCWTLEKLQWYGRQVFHYYPAISLHSHLPMVLTALSISSSFGRVRDPTPNSWLTTSISLVWEREM